METMRAVVAQTPGGPDVLSLVELPVPAKTGSEFLIRVHAAGVNPIDVKTRAGKGPAALAAWPLVLGNDFSGTVVESPYDAHPIKVGDEVYGMTLVPRLAGTYAEYVAVPALFVAKKPRNLSHPEAAGVPLAALTAWGAVVDVAKAHDGQRILIHAGAGGVGHFAIQFAAFFGAHVIATGGPRNLGWLRDLGAREVVDYTSAPFEERIAPVDIVIDLIGNVSADTGSRSLQVLKPGGIVVNVPSGSWPTLVEEAKAVGVRATEYRVSPDATTLSVITRLIESGDVRVYLDEVYDLAEAAAAHETLALGHTRGKLVLKVSD